METKRNETPEPDTLHGEHLTNGEKPIFACVEGYYDIPAKPGVRDPETVKDLVSRMKKEGNCEDLDDWLSGEDLKEKGFIQGSGFNMTPLSPNAKSSGGFLMCLGLAAVGRNSASQENIGFLSHQNPSSFLGDEEELRNALNQRLNELKDQSVTGSVDIVIFAGEYDTEERGDGSKKEYQNALAFLKEEVKKVFGFEPVIITGPKVLPLLKDGDPRRATWEEEAVFLDTENRRLFISRPSVGDASAESFLPKDIGTQKEKWEEIPVLRNEE